MQKFVKMIADWEKQLLRLEKLREINFLNRYF